MMFFIAHSFINLFAGGRSDSKTILFPIYVLVLFLFVYFKKDILKRLSIWWGIITISLLYIYGLVSHLLLFHSYDLSFKSFAITGNNGELSSTVIYHIHEAKGIIGFVLSKMGVNEISTLDAGGAYVQLLPSWWFVLGLLLLVASILFATLFIVRFLNYYSAGNKWKNTIFIIWYAVVSFSLIKTAIDGGILTPSLLALVVSMYLFNYMEKQKDTRAMLLIIFIITIVGFVLALVFPDWSGSIVLMQSFGTLLLLTTLSLIMFGAPKNIYILISVSLLLLSWWMASSRDREVFRYGQIPVNTGDVYFSYSLKNHSIEKSKSDITTKIKDIVRLQHKNLSYAPITVPGKTCSQNGLPQFADLVIQTKEPIKTFKTPYLNIIVKGQEHRAPWWINNTTIIMQSCLPEVLTMIDDTLKKQGFDFYVIVNPVFYDEPVAH